MSFCAGKKATVKYKFNDGEQKIYVVESEQTPITVEILDSRPSDKTENFDSKGYCLLAFTQFRQNVRLSRIIDWKYDAPISVDNRTVFGGQTTPSLWVRSCATPYLWYRHGYSIVTGIVPHNPSPSSPDRTCGCPSPLGCRITIYDKDGNSIFSDAGDCPITYEVSCAGCPEGTLDCDGCCADCYEINFKLKIITESIGKLI